MSKVVDVWVGSIKSKSDFDAYFEDTYSDDDGPISKFAEDQGESFYDHDFVEFIHFDEPQTLIEVLKPLSYSSGFAEAILAQASDSVVQIPNCVFADYDQQFERPQSVNRDAINMIYLGKFEYDPQAESIVTIERRAIIESRPKDADIYLNFRSGSLLYEGVAVQRIPVQASYGLLIGTGEAMPGRRLLNLGDYVPGIAKLQAEIRYSVDKEYWEITDLASNGLTHYRKQPLNAETVAPFEGILFSFGEVEFQWSLL